jgi:hypothetical protein
VSLLLAPSKSFSQTNVAPTIIVGKSLVRAIREADDRGLARALILSQFFVQRGLGASQPNVTVVLAPTEKPPYAAPSFYTSLPLGPPGYNPYKAAEASWPAPYAPNLQMRVNIESTDPLWTLALEVHNPNPFPVPLNFVTGQQFDFILEAQGTGQKIWQWSAGKASNPYEKATYWFERGESKRFLASFDPKSVAFPEKTVLVLKGVLNVFPTALMAEAQIVYAEK